MESDEDCDIDHDDGTLEVNGVSSEIEKKQVNSIHHMTLCHICFKHFQPKDLRDHLETHDFSSDPEKSHIIRSAGIPLLMNSTIDAFKVVELQRRMNLRLNYLFQRVGRSTSVLCKPYEANSYNKSRANITQIQAYRRIRDMTVLHH
jgi:hypothetical protein